jgi:tetratricopeptide (TPR) repeat protein
MPSIEQLEALLAREPGDPFLMYGIAQEHAKAGRFAEAVVWYDRTLSVDPAYCYAYFHKAKALEGGGDVAGAVSTIRAGIVAAKAARDQKALSELGGYLDELE